MAMKDAIRIEHRDDLENVKLAKRDSARIVWAQKKGDEPIDDVRRWRLSWVDTARE